MGKKKVDQNGRYGFLVFENDLVQEIKHANLSGIDFYPIDLGRNKSNYKVGHIIAELPQLSDKSVIKKFQICKTCGRSGHYSNYNKVDEYWYSKAILDNAHKDFYRTWEYFGIWDMEENLQSIIVSQRVRQFFKRFKLRHLKYEPIYEE